MASAVVAPLQNRYWFRSACVRLRWLSEPAPCPRIATPNKSLRQTELFSQAKELGLDPGRIGATGLAQAIKAEKERRWKIENGEAIKETKAYFREHGLPLAKYRQF